MFNLKGDTSRALNTTPGSLGGCPAPGRSSTSGMFDLDKRPSIGATINAQEAGVTAPVTRTSVGSSGAARTSVGSSGAARTSVGSSPMIRQPSIQARPSPSSSGESSSRLSTDAQAEPRARLSTGTSAPLNGGSAPKTAAANIGRAIPCTSSKLTLAEIKKLLEGYVSLPRARWGELVRGQHLRYTRAKDNEFVRGGFLLGVTMQRNKRIFTLANGFDPSVRGYYVWVVQLDSIGALFCKREAVARNIV